MRTFSKVLAFVLCVSMLFTTAFASGLTVSFVDFAAGTDTITARVNLRNDDSAEALSGKVIIASYDENGNLIATGESTKAEVTKGAETIVTASVADGGASYKAFVWDDAYGTNTKHTVKGAIEASDFKADTGVSNGMQSKNRVHTFKINQTEGILYTNLRGRDAADDSTETGGRLTTYNANSQQFHEITYVDESLKGYDYFVFTAGFYTYDDVTNPNGILSFDVTRDSEVIIMTSNEKLDFEGFEYVTPDYEGQVYGKARYMTTEFVKALQAIGITVTYDIAGKYNDVLGQCKADDRESDPYYNEYLKAAYESASDDAKATFDTNYNKFLTNKATARTNTADYSALYSATYTVPEGEDSVSVHIPANTATYTNSKGEEKYYDTRNLIVVVKPLANRSTKGAFTPIAKTSNLNAVPALKGVEIDGEYVSIDSFVSNAYSYKLNPLGGCVLPVIKGITTDNALYSSTDYDIASDGKTAVATITVKNLYTEATPAVYTVNISIDNSLIPADAYDIVDLNGTTIVDDTDVLASKTVTPGKADTGCPVDAPVSVVNNMTYADYIAYINEYYGYKEGDANYIVGTGNVAGTEKIVTSAFAYGKDLAVGNKMGSEGTRRQITVIAPKYAIFKDLYRFYGSVATHQIGSGNGGWFTGSLYAGVDDNRSTVAGEKGLSTHAKTDKLPAVPWFTTTMKEDGTVYVAAVASVPVLTQKGYTLLSSDVEAFSGIDTNNSSTVAGPKYIYCKTFKAGETVEIFNTANGQIGGHPANWFFSTGIPAISELTYGKKSSAAVATSFNSKVTNGVLYKNLFADVYTDSNTTGGRWVSDFHPLGSGQRIKSIEDPSLVGCDYFTFSINNRTQIGTNPGTNILEFKVTKDCEVVIYAKASDGSAVFGDFEKKTNVAGLTGFFPQANFLETVKNMGIPTTDAPMEMVEDLYSNSGLTFTQIYDKWLSAYFPGSTKEELLALVNSCSKKTTIGKELFADVDSISAVSGNSGNHPYTVSYTKAFKAGDTVAIPDPTGKAISDRPIVVVVKPQLKTTITDHVTDFQIVAENGAGTFILGPGANANVKATYSDRLIHNYTSTSGEPAYASAYSINGQRTFGVTDEVLGLENCYYLRYYNQAGTDKLISGVAKADWIGGSGKEDLAWMTFKVNQDCDIIIVPAQDVPNFVKSNGWTKNPLADYAFTLKRQANGSYQDYTKDRSQKVMYIKSYNAGDTVTLYNMNNGKAFTGYDIIPYFAFVRVK